VAVGLLSRRVPDRRFATGFLPRLRRDTAAASVRRPNDEHRPDQRDRAVRALGKDRAVWRQDKPARARPASSERFEMKLTLMIGSNSAAPCQL
jgi:hypothetical protein